MVGQHSPLRTYHGVFSRTDKPSEDITRRLFLMNMKKLKEQSGQVRSVRERYHEERPIGYKDIPQGVTLCLAFIAESINYIKERLESQTYLRYSLLRKKMPTYDVLNSEFVCTPWRPVSNQHFHLKKSGTQYTYVCGSLKKALEIFQYVRILYNTKYSHYIPSPKTPWN